jgi:hypothetical protein
MPYAPKVEATGNNKKCPMMICGKLQNRSQLLLKLEKGKGVGLDTP